jgi:four helix bundle protein
MSGTFEDLDAWQLAMDLVCDIYPATKLFPKDETFGLASQMRRAAVSVPSNIAEGKGRTTDKDFSVFLGYARGSLNELQTQTLLAHRLGYIDDLTRERLIARIQHVRRVLSGLINFASTKRPKR